MVEEALDGTPCFRRYAMPYTPPPARAKKTEREWKRENPQLAPPVRTTDPLCGCLLGSQGRRKSDRTRWSAVSVTLVLLFLPISRYPPSISRGVFFYYYYFAPTLVQVDKMGSEMRTEAVSWRMIRWTDLSCDALTPSK